jgi:hypothetical protein
MTSGPVDWHQALARVIATEEEARTLEAQNNTLSGQHDQILAAESLKKRLAT